ncbi:putative transcription activator [Halogeometricum borinquense DSM 11551]|uniref:Transcription activator n=2 Tax=Halogeometricum borinquense TaxID=60847 RepID=E4NU74_HALBP|nr:TenA family protein [Halogeometricum borinquense]ADQ68594.1 putative transcription activator [Halogeometricum borinquense DSM 11551]ELY25535.1 putative transcription activator [Halogeometricum borinquense DSM 11551]RYJ08578.1 transcriptional regulator [Halogeometricum borinquense]
MSREETASERVPETFEAYAETTDEARFTDWLRERSQPDWDAATTHRFTRELGADELDDEVFRRYLVQDYAFLETLVGLVGHAVGDAPTMAAKSQLTEFLGTLTADENDYFERSFEALGVPPETYTDPDLTPTTMAMEDLLERAAREGGYAETLAVFVPAEWIYREWATAVANESPSRFYLAEWIELHAVEEFQAVVGWLRDELDREGAAAAPQRRRRLERLFRRTASLEVAFFDAAYDSDGKSATGDADVPGGEK